ncbi:MAG TPA: inositol monophosphatase family protein [Gemmatimonadales bacterium]|nr:inositol monophosphatase family protein [Gemmatimonadales bacterium]
MLSPIDLLDLAESAARRAGRFLATQEPPPDPAGWTLKDQRDYVTEVDRESERLVASYLVPEAPGSRMLGEELSPSGNLEGLVWIVDPLDGTTNFLHRVPVWAVSIAAAVDGVLQAGVVYDVPRGLLYRAARGQGAWVVATEGGAPLPPARLSVSRIADPAQALIGTGFPFKHLDRIEEYQRQFAAVAGATSGIRRPGAASLDLVDVAAGRFDGFWELMLAPWDIAAGMLLVREAGGVVTDLAGRTVGPEHTGIVAGNPAIHAWLLGAVRS